MGDSGIEGVPARTVLAVAAAAFIVADVVMAMGWFQRVDAHRLLSGLRHARFPSAREFFAFRMVGLKLFVAVVEPFYGPWPLSIVAVAFALLFLLTGLAFQAEAERSGTADAERDEDAAYRAKLQAMTSRERLKFRATMAALVVVAGAVLIWFKSLW